MAKVIWFKPVRGLHGKIVQRIPAKLITVSEDYCTVELASGERHAAKTQDVKLVNKTSA